MKYEMIFGDQKRFNEQNNEMAEVMLWHDFLGPNFVSLKELSRMNSEGSIPHGSVVLAMRRIIAEPKRWTVEDQKAGRLRSEWIEHAIDLYMSSPKDDVASMGDVYDALLSGELQAPTKGE
jgi:hypothetical protein